MFGNAYEKGYNKGFKDGKQGKNKVNTGHLLAAFPNIIDPTESPDEFERGYEEGYEKGCRDRNMSF